MIPLFKDQVKSEEEWRVVLWLREATECNLVRRWDYEPQKFTLIEPKIFFVMKQLKTKVKNVERSLHQEATYTPDFLIELTEVGMSSLAKYFEKALAGSCGTKMIYIDSKGSFNPFQNDQRYFSLVQKVMYDKHNIWPQKVIPFEKKVASSLFKKTWAPKALRFMKRKNELNACGRECCGIEEFLTRSK